MYLLEETLDAIEESGHTTDDVLYVGSEDGRLQLPWDQAEPVLRVRYDNGYGDQEMRSQPTCASGSRMAPCWSVANTTARNGGAPSPPQPRKAMPSIA